MWRLHRRNQFGRRSLLSRTRAAADVDGRRRAATSPEPLSYRGPYWERLVPLLGAAPSLRYVTGCPR